MTNPADLQQARAALTMIQPEPFNAEAPPEALDGEVTPTGLHYVRSNFPLPDHDGRLTIGGAVDHPLTLTLDDLRAMPSITRLVTLECAGNGRLAQTPLPVGEPWGNYAVSTAEWKGVLLHQLLEQAGPQAGAVDVRFRGADHGRYYEHDDMRFIRSLDLPQVTDPDAEIMIAYEMNGEPLSPDHGAPFRVIAPRWYGVASVKWITDIDIINKDFEGEFQVGHYMYEWDDRPHEPVTLMRVRARITDPAPGAIIPAGDHIVRGKAWTGTGPITSVDIALTGEGEWLPADLQPPTGPYHWQDWTFKWTAPAPGRHTLRARATDAAGNLQPDTPPWNRLGYGNNAVEVLYVDVA
jgi:DMSO/TMAO reductase YedYZ molybdopterin-dependent catalytic subunit